MAGRPKAAWTARVRSIGRALIPGKGIQVHMRIALDREPDREIDIHLSINDAIKWRNALDIMISKTESEMGIERCEHCGNMLSPDKNMDYCAACGRIR